MRRSVVMAALAISLASSIGIAEAHNGIAASQGFGAGLAHPFLGLDHLLATAAVGVWASQVGRRALWLMPAVFLTAMLLGIVSALAGAPMPLVELGLFGSIILMGLLLVTRMRVSTMASMSIAAAFALVHGHVHGIEMVASRAGLDFAAGLGVATLLLLLIGSITGRAIQQLLPVAASRHAG